MTPSLLAQFDPAILGAIMPIASLVFVIAIIAIKKHAETQRQKLWHETARVALEKGQPVPLVPAFKPEEEKKRNESPIARDIRAGLILFAIGAGLYLGSRQIQFGPGLFAFYIPVFIGAALLLNAGISVLMGKKDNSDDKTPSSKA
jgi:hypothetical protein